MAPKKVQAFLQLLIRRSILTWGNLSRRGWVDPGRCILYQKENENIDHLFVECQYTTSILIRLKDEYAREEWGREAI